VVGETLLGAKEAEVEDAETLVEPTASVIEDGIAVTTCRPLLPQANRHPESVRAAAT